jgi:hypothetical protein
LVDTAASNQIATNTIQQPLMISRANECSCMQPIVHLKIFMSIGACRSGACEGGCIRG